MYCPPDVKLVNLYVPSARVVTVAVFAPLRLIFAPPRPAPFASVTRPEMERVGDGDGDGEGDGEGDGVGEAEGVGVGCGDAFVLDESDFK